MIKIPTLFHDKNSIGFLLWCTTGILITVIFYKPFQQPILFDRAYLLYMSQVVFRGEPLYQSTTFGYTPLSTIIVALIMKLGSLFSFNTIESARVFGLMLYGTMCGSFFLLLKEIFHDKAGTWIGMSLFVGLGYLQILSGVNAEPKIFVLLFSIVGMYFLIKDNWLITGLCFSAAAMCWHVSVISLIACSIVLPWHSNKIKPALLNLAGGVLIATIPVIFYLSLTNGWLDFWNQAILRKLVVEGEELSETPFKWLYRAIFPSFITEAGHFIAASMGLLLLISYAIYFKEKCLLIIRNKRAIYFLISYALVWFAFNTLEFQGPPDIIPLLFVIVILGTFVILSIKSSIKSQLFGSILVGIFISYNFFDVLFYKVPFTYQDEIKLIKKFNKKYEDPFVIGFEEYYTLMEKPMPTKYMRFANYEDYFLLSNRKCEGIIDLIRNSEYNYFIELNKNKTVDKGYQLKSSIRNIIGFKKYPAKIKKKGKCSHQILSSLTSLVEIDSFKIEYCYLPLDDFFVRQSHYSIFKKQEIIDKLNIIE